MYLNQQWNLVYIHILILNMFQMQACMKNLSHYIYVSNPIVYLYVIRYRLIYTLYLILVSTIGSMYWVECAWCHCNVAAKCLMLIHRIKVTYMSSLPNKSNHKTRKSYKNETNLVHERITLWKRRKYNTYFEGDVIKICSKSSS